MKIYLIIIIGFISCETDKRQFYNIKVYTDTSIIIKRKIENRTFMTVIVKGKLSKDCLVTLFRNKNHSKNDNVTKREYIIKEGIVNDTLGINDLYGDSAKIIFNHQKNQAGQLKLEVLF